MDQARLQRLREKAQADRWKVPPEVFSNALERSAEKAFAGRTPSDADLDRYYDSLHLADLALACACAMGREDAWDHFVKEFRPGMYRAADAIDPGGGARDIAQALYAELFGLKEKDGIRQSVFRYFHGRSSLATWLRSLISQRFVDRHRETRRLDPLPDESSAAPLRAASTTDRSRSRAIRRGDARRAGRGHRRARAARSPPPRLLLCAGDDARADRHAHPRARGHGVAAAGAGRRKAIREDVERRLRDEHGFSKAEIDECFASIVDDAGNLDLDEWLAARRRSLAKAAQEIRSRSFYAVRTPREPRSRPHPGTGAQA